MDEYYATITQNGYELTATDVNLPHQYSGNIPIKIIKDTEMFGDYELMPFFVHSNFNYVDVVASNEAFPMEYNAETQVAILPYEAFKKRGYLFISLVLKENNGDKVIYTGTVMLDIKNSLNGENTIPTETIWVEAIVQFVNNYMNTNYEPKYNDLFQNSQELQEDAENLHQTVTTQQETLDGTLQTTQELQETTSQLVSNAENLQETAEQQQTQVGDLVDNINTKLENGEFNGKSVLYGEGIPAKDLGNVGDVYINTSPTTLYPFYLFTKDGEDWTPRWTMQGVDGTDTLPILGTLFLPEDQVVPSGYGKSDEYYIPADYIGVDGNTTLMSVVNNKTSLKSENTVIDELTLTENQIENPTSVKVQMKDKNGKVFYVANSIDNVYLTGTDGSEIALDEFHSIVGQLINSISYFNVNPVEMLAKMNNYIPSIETSNVIENEVEENKIENNKIKE